MFIIKNHHPVHKTVFADLGIYIKSLHEGEIPTVAQNQENMKIINYIKLTLKPMNK
jgi:hypothetical protein